MCNLCETKPVYEFTNQRKLCARCFVRYFQKKVLYIIRRFEMIKQREIIGYKNSGDFRDVVLEDVLKMFAKKADVELVKLPSKKKVDKIAISSAIDLCANGFTEKIINKDVKNLDELKVVDKKIIKPLYLFLDIEVLLYAKAISHMLRQNTIKDYNNTKLKKLKIVKVKKVNSDVEIFINELEKKHPEIKRAIVNSFLKLDI